MQSLDGIKAGDSMQTVALAPMNPSVAPATRPTPPTPVTTTANAETVVNGESNINIINSNEDKNNSQKIISDFSAANTTPNNSNIVVGDSNSNATQNVTSNEMHEILFGTKNSNGASNNPMNLSNSNTAAINNILNVNLTTPSTTAISDANNSNGNSNSQNNSNQHFQSTILQQNAAIMEQNAATLQHFQNLQQTNKLFAANPEAAATLGMLAPIMNMNLTTGNPVQLLATATPSLNLNHAGNATNAAANTFLPSTTALQATAGNLSDVGSAYKIATPPISAQQQQLCLNQPQAIPVQAQAGTIAIAPNLPGTGFANNINANNGIVMDKNNGIVDNNGNNNGAVQNILRTAFMLQNGGLSFLQPGTIPQQQQLITTPTASGFMLLPNGNNNSPFGIVPATNTATNTNITSNTNDNSGRSSDNNSPKLDNIASNINSNDGGPTSGAAAAANAAASVLPPASMNLPFQQQLHRQQLNPSLTSHMGIDLTNANAISSNNNAIAFLSSGALTNNNINSGSNSGLQIGGLATLQQQQRIQPMAYAQMNLSQPLPHLTPSLSQRQQQNQQQPSLRSNLEPSTAQIKHQQESQVRKKESCLSRPLYLDHDSNCLTAYQCFLRKQIELFEVGQDEMTGTAQGRNTPLHYGQVGIRCRHCAHLPKTARARGGVYYSRTIDGVYQVAQNMSKLHFLKACTLIPENTKSQLKNLQSVSSRASGGKEYWAEGLRVLGIVEDGGMLRFASSTSSSSTTQISKSTK